MDKWGLTKRLIFSVGRFQDVTRLTIKKPGKIPGNLNVIGGKVLHRVKETKEECVHKCYHYQQNLISLKEDSVWLHSELEDLRKENAIFTSMLGEIENEPHGHEILKTLWDKMGKADTPDGNN